MLTKWQCWGNTAVWLQVTKSLFPHIQDLTASTVFSLQSVKVAGVCGHCWGHCSSGKAETPAKNTASRILITCTGRKAIRVSEETVIRVVMSF